MNKCVRLISSGHSFIFLVGKLWLLCVFVLSISCSKPEKEFVIGAEFLQSQSKIRRVDTFAVELSTVMIDSFPTSNNGSMLVGDFYDPVLGSVSCKSFFQIGTPESYNFAENDTFDYAKIILVHTGYTFGDTTRSFTLSFSKLSKVIKAYSDGYLYNHTNISKTEAGLIAKITYTPRPKMSDTLEILVEDEFARDMFERIANEDIDFSNDDRFVNRYLPGIVLEADPGRGCILDYYASAEKLILRVVSHRHGKDGTDTLYNDFPMINPTLQFNQILHDFSTAETEGLKDSPLLVDQREAVPSSKTENMSFLYGGVGLMTKVSFPSLPELLMIENNIVLRAELVLRPKTEDYKVFPIPANIMLYNTDKNNYLGTEFYNNDGSLYNPVFVRDTLYNDGTTYSFDISSFIINELSDSYVDADHSILISSLPSRFTNTFDRIIFEADAPAPLLKLYIVTY